VALHNAFIGAVLANANRSQRQSDRKTRAQLPAAAAPGAAAHLLRMFFKFVLLLLLL
jgi:hypothetical protein